MSDNELSDFIENWVLNVEPKIKNMPAKFQIDNLASAVMKWQYEKSVTPQQIRQYTDPRFWRLINASPEKIKAHTDDLFAIIDAIKITLSKEQSCKQ